MEKIGHSEIRFAAMDLLSRREHLRQELAEKLRKRFSRKKIDELTPVADLLEQIEAVLDQLVVDKLLSEQRYVESFVRQRTAKGCGPGRIRQELQAKGVDKEILQDALSNSETDWMALARDVRQKKFGTDLPEDYREKSRQLRFLNYRGFTGEFAASAVEMDS